MFTNKFIEFERTSVVYNIGLKSKVGGVGYPTSVN